MGHSDDHRVIVLAAGRGRRMGGPKALMEVDARPWWHVQRGRIAASGFPQLWVVSEDVARAMRESDPGGTPELLLAEPDGPMFESLLIGLRSVAATRAPQGVFVLPVDTPWPGGAAARALIAGHPAAIPTFEGRGGHPVWLSWAWVSGLLAQDAQGGIPASQRRLDALLTPIAARVPVDAPEVVLNLNTPEDVRRFMTPRREQ